MKLLLGQKIGMTQVWDDKGRLIGATVVFAEPNSVIKTGERIQLAVAVPGKTVKAQKKLAEKTGSKRGVWLKEATELEADQEKVSVSQFTVGEKVKVSGVTKGKGMAGTIKRHNFSRGPMTHGGDNHRGPGSIGAQRPQRVPKGQKMSGRMGGENLTIRGAKVVDVKPAENLIIISGPIPGPARGRVIIKNA
ncbi:MAG TPA: 50S ribosomal protein L3 [Candidatus Saccharimonadales bacterium]|nr:50S ribosomal protein L3 [Candidatus Saccharimonadales bacterium]